MSIGNNIKKLRNEQQITQEQLAEHLSISYQAISKWENNISVPDIALIPSIAEYFQVTIDELFKPNMIAYKNKARRLGAIYENTRRESDFLKRGEDFARAEQAFKSLLENNENCTHDNLMFYAVLYSMRSQDYVDKAIELFTKSIELGETVKDADYYKAQRLLIGFLYRNNRIHESVNKHEALVHNEPNNIQNLISLTIVYWHMKEFEKAWDVIVPGLKIEPENAILLYWAGEISKNFGKYEDAINFWDKSYEIDKEIPDNLFSKAFLYQELGKDEKAIEMWEEIIKWLEIRGYDVDTQFPKRELTKLKNKNK
jgi:transcriptional regulator with XRE-family HTH domain